MPSGCKEVLNRIDGLIDHRGRLNAFLAQLDLAARHSRDVEQIVDQTRKLLDVPLNCIPAPFQVFRVP